MKKVLFRFLIPSLVVALSLSGLPLIAQTGYIEIAPNQLANTAMDGRPTFEQFIYTKSEMGNQSHTLYGIELTRLSSSTSVDTVILIDIYLGETTTDTFYSTNSWLSPQSMTRVFTGTFHFKGGQSKDTIVFDQPYQYSGNKNLCFTMFDHTGTIIRNFPMFSAHRTPDGKKMYLTYMKYGSDTVDMNYADRWPNAVGAKWHYRYNIKFFTNQWYIGHPAMPTVQAPYTASISEGPNQVERTWKTYGDEGCWWEFNGGSTGAVCKVYGNDWSRAKLVSPLIEVNPGGTARLTFSLKNENYSGDSLIVYYSKSDYADQWVPLKAIGATSGYEQQQIDIPSCSHFRIALEALNSGYGTPICVKNVSVINVANTASPSTQPYYAFMVNGGGTNPSDNNLFYNFSLGNVAATPTVVSQQFGEEVYCAEQVDGYLYYVAGIRDEYGLYRTDFAEGSTIQEGEYWAELNYSNTFVELRYDEFSQSLLGLEEAGYTTNLYEIDLSDGETTLLTTLDGHFSAMAVSPDGTIYLLKYGDRAELYRLFSRYSSYASLVETDPLPACNMSTESMTFDRNTGKLIWLQSGTGDGDAGIYGIDPVSGTWEFYGKLGGTNSSGLGLFTIPAEPIADVQSTINWYGFDHTPNYEDESLNISLVKFSMQNPSGYNTLCDIPSAGAYYVALAGELVNDTLFYLLYGMVGDNEQPSMTLFSQPFNGQTLQGTPASLFAANDIRQEYLFGLTYNPFDKNLYTCHVTIDDSYTSSVAISRIDRASGTLTDVIQLDGYANAYTNVPTALAVSPNGVVYAMIMDGQIGMMQLCTINASGVSVIGNTGVYDRDGMGQGMYFDPGTDELFWTCLDGNGLSVIYKVDLTTGQAARVGSLDTEMNVLTCFFLGHSTQGVNSPDDFTVSVAPNPATDRIVINAESDITMLQLYNLQGSLQRIEGGCLGASASLDVQSLPAGTYILSVTTAQGTATRKVVVDR